MKFPEGCSCIVEFISRCENRDKRDYKWWYKEMVEKLKLKNTKKGASIKRMCFQNIVMS